MTGHVAAKVADAIASHASINPSAAEEARMSTAETSAQGCRMRPERVCRIDMDQYRHGRSRRQ